MKKIVSLALIAFLPVFAFAAATSINLSDAIKKDIVKMEAVNSKGNYKGKSVTLTITNKSANAIAIKVDLGIILKPENPAFQPLVLSGEEVLTLKAHEKDDIEVEVFCGNAPKACPINGLHYTFFRIGGDTLIKILRYIKDHNLFDHLGQAAVWTITNYHPLSSVYDSHRDSISRRLINLIVDVTKREKPTFYTPTVENETPAQPAFTSKTDKIYVPFEITLTGSRVMTLGVFNSSGQWVKSIFERKLFEPGKHSLMAELNPAEYEAGKYFLRLMGPEAPLQEKEVAVSPYVLSDNMR